MFRYLRSRPLASGWLSQRFPGIDFLSHDAGHLLEVMFGWKSNPHWGPFHIASNILIGLGFWLLASAWKVLYEAQRHHRLATTGAYAHVRHPQYVAFILIMAGFLLQWPTLVTLAMFPVLVVMYVLLARREARDAQAEFGEDYTRYADRTPEFITRCQRRFKTDTPRTCSTGRIGVAFSYVKSSPANRIVRSEPDPFPRVSGRRGDFPSIPCFTRLEIVWRESAGDFQRQPTFRRFIS